MSDQVVWNWDELTADEAEILEDAAEAPVPTIIAAVSIGNPTTRMLRALVWIARRRTEPKLTLEQVRSEYTQYTALAEAAEREVEAPPVTTDPGDEGTTTSDGGD